LFLIAKKATNLDVGSENPLLTWIKSLLFIPQFTMENALCFALLWNLTPPQLASAQWSLFRLRQLENEEMEAVFNTIVPWPMLVRQSLRNSQRCGSFIVGFYK
jgi:hypothetical protein